MSLPVFDLQTEEGRSAFNQRLQRRRESTSAAGEAAQLVAKIIDAVAEEGDQAVVRYMRQWTDPKFQADDICVTPAQLAKALDELDVKLRDTLAQAIEHVRQYQRHILPRDPKPVLVDGAELGLRFTAVDSVGLAVPGGKAAYPSTVIMLAVPAQVAGVSASRVSVVTPPPTRGSSQPAGDVSPLVLATCALLGIERVYRIGGAQAIAALALGTETVDPVDMIVGPGNVYTQLAKQQLSGRVGIDGFLGPSEIVTIADDTADPARVASDLLAQAEHDPGLCFLIAWSADVIDAINDQMAEQIWRLSRREVISVSLNEWSGAALVHDEAHAVKVADALAAEHVNLAVADPQAMLKRLRHGGEFFLGDQTPVAAGDYYAGPSHCLPTGATARFASGVSVYTFLKRSGWVRYREGMSPAAIDAIARLAQAEGLDAHAASVRVRGKR